MSHAPRGYRVGRYVLHDEIARGGMASVHVGRLESEAGFKRTVAIKRLHPPYAESGEFTSMLLDEGRITARIQHPNVVPVLDVVQAEGELLLVMEYIHGESLASLLEAADIAGARPPLRFVAQIFANVLAGLHAAHECLGDDGAPLLVVHRDVSPQNIIVGRDGIARILDFGIARAEQRLRTKTRDGVVRGKVPYMAPEQLSEEPVDRRADIYGASVALWEAITGRPLYDDAIPVVLAMKLTSPAELASKYVPDLPPRIDAIVAKGLATDPAQRWATADDMARALEREVPPVATREIAEWVRSLAGPELDRRAALVARAEESEPELFSGPLPVSSNALPSSAGRRSAYPTIDAIPAKPPSSRGVLLGLAAIVFALCAVGIFFFRRHKSGPEATPGATAAAVVSTAATSPPPPSAPALVEPAPSQAETASVAGGASPSAASSHGRRVAAGRRGAKGRTPAVTPSSPPVSPPAPEPSVAPTPVTPPPTPPPKPPASTTARVEVGAPRNIVGTTSPAVRQVLAGSVDRFSACYRAALGDGTNTTEGPGVLHLETDEEGVVVGVRVEAPIASAKPCVAAVVKGRRIPNVDTGRASADVPLVFTAQ